MATQTASNNLYGDKDLLASMVEDIQRQLAPPSEAASRDELNDDNLQIRLGYYVEATSNIVLDPWQRHMCARLEKLVYQKGQRLLLHAMPQAGKSIIVSQRLPSYILGHRPTSREKLACYNIDHATKFARINKELMQSPEYYALFPDPALRIGNRVPEGEWSTAARRKLRDAQASMKALGLTTGFVGQGADDLFIDDPYASPQEAASTAIRESVWTFWNESAKVRINDDTNVVVMFHRYNEDDIAGRLQREEGLQSEGGKWELIRYAAEWDGDVRPEVGGADPLGRDVGEILSPRFSRSFIEEQKKAVWVWLGQFQGKPTNKEGGFFKVARMGDPVEEIPTKLLYLVRTWDKASTKDDGDYTVGVLMALGRDGLIYILDMVRGQWDTDERDRIIKSTVQRDWVYVHKTLGLTDNDYLVRGMQDPGQAGKGDAQAFVKLLKGFPVKVETVSGDKTTNADPYSSYFNSGLVKLWSEIHSREPWHKAFREEHRSFPRGLNDDIVDACAHGFKELTLADVYAPGEVMSYAGVSGAHQGIVPDEERMRQLLTSEDELLERMMRDQEMETATHEDSNYYEVEGKEAYAASGGSSSGSRRSVRGYQRTA